MARPTTPPPSTPSEAYLLTPPPTAPLDKRILLKDEELDSSNTLRLFNTNDAESPASFFEDFNEGSDVEAGEKSETETVPSSEGSLPASPIPSTSPVNEKSALEDDQLFTPLAVALAITEPFPFMKLPLALRRKVYEHLLVIPSLICVRQKHRVSEDQEGAHLHSERRELVAGIAYALPQLSVDGYKVPFSRFSTTNSNIILASKEVYSEARAVLYGKNNFEIARPSTEMSPPSDFSVRLFPTGCQRLVTKLSIRIRSFYDMHWLFIGSYNVVKNYYRGLTTLTLILELQSTDKGFGRQWAKADGEEAKEYVDRLQAEVARGLSSGAKSRKAVKVPAWINLRVMFSGERYNTKLGALNGSANVGSDGFKREELRQGLMEMWETFRKGGR
jgi:uncharacterized protein YegP (UPF0339 family)